MKSTVFEWDFHFHFQPQGSQSCREASLGEAKKQAPWRPDEQHQSLCWLMISLGLYLPGIPSGYVKIAIEHGDL